MKRRKEYLDELTSYLCQCGMRKGRKMSFCKSCFHRLPNQMRKDLFKDMGRGYRKAYDAAVEYLNK